MKHFPRLATGAVAVMLATTACSGNSRNPISYPGGPRSTVIDRNGDGYDDRTGARIEPNKNKGKRDEVRCNAGRGNGNGNGRCRNGNGNRGRGRDGE
ncbi:hypothetical protein [Longimicrobium sp.]|uniref:hypothetical protein n=1 Tax=Longimicrobium sp. TaxID=2029185 RepID=UPI003B3A5AA4